MVKITRQEIIKLAQMSQIEVTNEEIPAVLDKIDAVLTYASRLTEIVQAQTQFAMPYNTNVMRSDQVIKTPAEPLLDQAPARQDNYFVVPMILKSDT